ncbi:mitochondrial import receptor subunit TOM20 homolog [Lingula anatina]|uniref:Mitochondrial import receptor subunit TOM20 homolog n=1 Tax=Lingula anatina TaxID=7574 RepID=A0A1S3ILC8_LINAN|nr:mitochondrial import receptor subunit TOM20 homolog [Lingula anatina]|eukprot:XP_013399022.1 mitochondrial import receptor subunit TOM20 homolog [Lingula anatina]
MLAKSAVYGLAASAGLAFIGYCIYFDQKRRNDPLFKQKLRERRKKNKEKASKKARGPIPDLESPADRNKFFIQEVQVGEELLAQGDLEGAVEHLSNAVVVCGQPQQLLQVLQQTLPPQVIQMILQKLPEASVRLNQSASQGEMMEDDLE